jgi:class 3 adenylate cyclase
VAQKPSRTRCLRCGATLRLRDRFCAQCGANLEASLTSSGGAGLATPANDFERRQLTVVFCDLVGSTALSEELDAEDFKDIVVAFLRTVTDAMSRFGGTVARYVGDGALVYFGYPRAHELDAERAIEASLQTLDAIAALRFDGDRQLRARIGIATGPVVMGSVSGGIGPTTTEANARTPNLAARLQKATGPNTILVSPETHEIARRRFDWREVGPLPLEGISEPVRAWQVVGSRVAESRYEAMEERFSLPMLGRDDVRDVLLALWGKARRGQGQVALVRGEAGVGKSRMAAALLHDTSDQERETQYYFCSPYREGSPLYPCLQQLEHVAEFRRGDSPEQEIEKLRRALTGMPPLD